MSSQSSTLGKSPTSVRPIDHLVLAVETLDAARARYSALGFSVREDRQHPFGTENCCIFFKNGTYLEPLAVGDREGADAAIVAQNRFVRLHDSFIFSHGEGFAMLAFRSQDAEADQKIFVEAGYSTGPFRGFERKATAPDGSETLIGVRLASAADHRAPDVLFLACQHLSPEILWQDDNIAHDNGAVGVTGVYLSEPNPSDFQYYLETVTGDRSIRATSMGIYAETAHGPVGVLTPYAMDAMFGIDAAGQPRGLRLRLFRLAVDDLGAMKARLDDAGIGHFEHRGRIIVPAEAGQGGTIAFEQAEG
ncbi:MAG: VOC family protein [Alphaproteobacteria bacterium]